MSRLDRTNCEEAFRRLNDFLDVYRVEIQSILLQYGVPLLDEQDNAITAP